MNQHADAGARTFTRWAMAYRNTTLGKQSKLGVMQRDFDAGKAQHHFAGADDADGKKLIYFARLHWPAIVDDLALIEQDERWLLAEHGLTDDDLRELALSSVAKLLSSDGDDGSNGTLIADFDTTPLFPKPDTVELDAAVVALRGGLEKIDPLPNGVFSKRADLLAKDVCDAHHTKAAAQWAIQTLLDDGVLELEMRRWGGVIPNGLGVGPNSQIQAPAQPNTGQAIAKNRRLAFHQFYVAYQLDKEQKPFPENWAASDLRLSDVRMVLDAHNNRRDSQGFSPVQDMYDAVEARIEALANASEKCEVLGQDEELKPEHLVTIMRRLKRKAGINEPEMLTIEAAIAALLGTVKTNGTAALQAGSKPPGERAEAISQAANDNATQQQAISKLELETPDLDTESIDWIRTKEIVGEKSELVSTGTLANYRLESKGGIQTPNKMLGRDRDGRIWRRTGTPTSHPWYLRETLLGKLKTAQKP